MERVEGAEDVGKGDSAAGAEYEESKEMLEEVEAGYEEIVAGAEIIGRLEAAGAGKEESGAVDAKENIGKAVGVG